MASCHEINNDLLRKEMEELFESPEEIELFIRISDFGNPDFQITTRGGKQFYINVAELFGWKLQQHNLPGFRSHYRLLDQTNKCRVWVLNPRILLRAFDDYKATKKFIACYEKLGKK